MLDLNMMLEESKVQLEKKNQDMKIWEATLAEALERSIHLQENWDHTYWLS
jgi:hypothetical protein